MLYGLPPAENDGSRIRRWFYPVILSGFHSPPMRIIKCPLRYFAAKVSQRFDLSKKSCIFVHCYFSYKDIVNILFIFFYLKLLKISTSFLMNEVEKLNMQCAKWLNCLPIPLLFTVLSSVHGIICFYMIQSARPLKTSDLPEGSKTP